VPTLSQSEVSILLKAELAGEQAYAEQAALLRSVEAEAGRTSDSLDRVAKASGMSRDETEKLAPSLQRLQGDLAGARTEATAFRARLEEAGVSGRAADDAVSRLFTTLARRGVVADLAVELSRLDLGGRDLARTAGSVAAALISATDAADRAGGAGGGGGFGGLLATFGKLGPVFTAIGGAAIPVLIGSLVALAAILGPIIFMTVTWTAVTAAFTVGLTGLLAVVALGVGAFAALGLGVALLAERQFTNAQQAATQLAAAQTALTSATNAHDSAVRSLQSAEAGLTAGRAPTVAQANAIASAQVQVAATATALAAAHNNLAFAQAEVARTGTNVIDPLAAIKDHLQSVALVLGQQAYPLLVQMAQAADRLVKPLQDAGSALITYLGGRLPDLLGVGARAVTVFSESFGPLVPIFREFLDETLVLSPTFLELFRIFGGFAVGAIHGLLDNLLRLSIWFATTFPENSHVVMDGFDALGRGVQAFAATAARLVSWIVENWPSITAAAQATFDTIGNLFSLLGQGAHEIVPVIRVALATLGGAFELVGLLVQALSGHQRELQLILVAVGAIIGIVIAALIGVAAAIVAAIAVVLAIGIALIWMYDRFREVNDFLSKNFTATWNSLREVAKLAADDVVTAWQFALGATENAFHSIHDAAVNWMSAARDNVVGIAQGIASSVGGAFSAVGSAIHGDLEQARTILDSFISTVDRALGIGVPQIPEFAGGGLVPGSGTSDSVLGLLTPGEGILTRGAVSAIGGPGAVVALNASTPRFAGGGVVGLLTGGAQAVAGSALGGLSGFAGQIVGGLGKDVLSALVDWLGSHVTNLFGGGGTSVGGNVMGWILQAIAATGVPASWAAGLATIIQHESGGSNTIYNLTDSNALAGNPSLGLMQLTLSNMAAFGGITTDPVLQIVEGIRYIISRYQSIESVPGVASITAGGPYRPYDRGGWLMPGGKAVNLSGRPEYVLNPDQTAAGAGGNTYIINAPLGGITAEVVAEIQRKADWHSRTGHFS